MVANVDGNLRTGTYSSVSLNFMLRLNENRTSYFYGKIDVDNNGIGGHSQRDVRSKNAVTKQDSSIYNIAKYTELKLLGTEGQF
ncbi:hypothetical protein E2R58_09305 [Paenibacillus amylolyticus]|uniref:hypothetical protein n=1 Tax=Paenibacillus amylolyticus TaxID=1451 RepID=UPI00105964C8|nr:hypothetical protein [Paenibacillus amylolyticus]TDL69350.1 hypothetical protein E2R58_09305 [Paenibacillus amylolyticus]